MADDEEYRIKALKEELMREMEAMHGDLDKRQSELESNIRMLKWLFLAMIAVFGLIAALLANII